MHWKLHENSSSDTPFFIYKYICKTNVLLLHIFLGFPLKMELEEKEYLQQLNNNFL